MRFITKYQLNLSAMDYKSIITDIKEILRFKLYYMYIINAVSLIRTFHLSKQNFEPIIIIIIIHTPKNLGAKKIERERDKEGQWTAGLFRVANRGLKG